MISLGSGAFEPYAGIQASILLIRRAAQSHHVRFIDAESLFERSRESKGKNLSETAITQIVEAVESRATSGIAWTVTDQEIARLEWDLTVKRRGQSDFHSVLDLISKQMPVVELGDLATISTGLPVKSQDMVSQAADGLIPLLRTKDIERGVASRASTWIPGDLKGVSAGQKLRSGDILLSKSGTIGKSGVVRNGAVGAIASSGLYKIHVESDQVDPHYLLAYLNSPECRSWLSDQATGATIQHLPIGVLRELTVPIPPLQIQHRIVEQFRDQETDALGFLALLTGASERDSISEWIESTRRAMPPEGEPIDEPLEFSTLERLIGEMRGIRNRAAHGQESGPLVPWLLAFYESLNRLQGIQLVPKGASMLSLFQDALSGLDKASKSLSGREPHTARARSLTLGVQRFISAAIDALASEVEVSFSAEDETIWAGDHNIIHVRVVNDGALPLRSLQVTTSPNWGAGIVPFLGEAQSTNFQFDGDIAAGTEGFQLEISWTAETLDGRKVQGKRQLAFEVGTKSIVSAGPFEDLGPSPYVCGNPVRPGERVFFGRDELISEIRTTVQEKGNVILLEGNRRAGKSSILAHLEGLNGIQGWLCVSASLQGTEGDQARVGVPTEDVFRALAKAIADALCLNGFAVPLPTGEVLASGTSLDFQTRRRILDACRQGIPVEAPFSYFREFLVAALESVAKKDIGIVLMLDEFDKLQEGIDSHVTSPQVPENIRSLVQSLPRFSAILTGSRRITRLRQEYWSVLFGLGTALPVSSLSEEAALSLVLEPVRGRLVWSTEAAQYALHITARQPYILQCLCNEVFLLAGQTKTRSISTDIVRKAANSDTLWQHFASLWDYPGNDRRRFILALCEKYATDEEPFTFATLKESLAAYGVQAADETLDTDLDHLIELEMIRRMADPGGTTYKLEIPLMGDWIRTTQDFDVLKMRAIVYSENTDG